ncbi:CDP-diacylglycerol--glycerol-3-phosphate 3-phosphatidyltransferase [Salinactinospora qingdaonensis]|uniref:CDP-diacylglycerol--glycerol-3-phosphate 3-phosphatidyltransferase n=1 Tax=Salinactinospora qingdaonensis TaxID=702744 RepID=A0ABP7GCB8_9ACTN
MNSGPDPASVPAANVPLWNIANILTAVRLIMVPVFIVCMFLDHPVWRFVAFVVFLLAAITDRVDGELARRRNLVTDFGKIADPIADKALTGGALVVLSILGELWWWVTLVILIREWGITALRFAVLRRGVIPASRGGKLKTVLQVVAIAAYLFPLPEPLVFGAYALMGAALAVTVITGADYVIQAVRLWRSPPAASSSTAEST